MVEQVFKNARIVLADEVIIGSLVVRDGLISEYGAGPVAVPGDDLAGEFLLPGLVELHTDHLEQHYHPRPGVIWPAISAVMAHDAQIAASGITTVYDALRAGTFDPDDQTVNFAVNLLNAIRTAQQNGQLRAEHFIHLRCELPCPDTSDSALAIAGAGRIDLLSIMDHTPGARQFVSLDKFKEYYIGKKLIQPEKMDHYINERLAMQQKYAASNKSAILALARELDVKLASHDDATAAHVEEAYADGVAIAEFPTTREAAQAAHNAGLAVMMGAPNVVRGGSHSGNISALDVAVSGHLDVLSSDYVPASLLDAVFSLETSIGDFGLADAVRLVTANPARAVGLNDRGEIAAQKRADLIHVAKIDSHPVVRRVWRAGGRVM